MNIIHFFKKELKLWALTSFFIYLDALRYVSYLVMKVSMFHLSLETQSVIFRTFFIYFTLLELDGKALALFSILMISIGNQFLWTMFLMAALITLISSRSQETTDFLCLGTIFSTSLLDPSTELPLSLVIRSFVCCIHFEVYLFACCHVADFFAKLVIGFVNRDFCFVFLALASVFLARAIFSIRAMLSFKALVANSSWVSISSRYGFASPILKCLGEAIFEL